MSTTNLQTTDREELITRLYKQAFPTVAKYVANRGGSFDEAKDVFHDALVICYEKMAAGSLPPNETGYLIGTAKNLWLKRYRENIQHTAMDGIDLSDEAEEETPSGRLLHFLQKAGKKCMELLTAFYYHQQPLDEIAGTFGFSGVRSATVQKYKCLEKVRETIKQKALVYEDFME